MGFEEASRKYGRALLLIFGSIITGFLYIAPAYLASTAAKLVIDSRGEWMLLYTMIVVFYFKNQAES